MHIVVEFLSLYLLHEYKIYFIFLSSLDIVNSIGNSITHIALRTSHYASNCHYPSQSIAFSGE